MLDKFYFSASELRDDQVGRINIFNYLIDADKFFIINIDPNLDKTHGSGTVKYIRDTCDIYIADIYF